MTEQRCRDCNVPHASVASSKGGGMGRILPWREGRCPACVDRRREYRSWGAAHIVAARLDPADAYLTSYRDPEQVTLEEVLG